ncbi:hypothetical protein [Myxococcus landrumensis]|uniref:Lipoprotein n=1 Tax=Myxococcus landrumensis TaxID=2813577 RepID=A0ABX7N099_9BACT|nr:hypothetical protein [Myxococcus landrumus]QSQ11878.1 hypothetical protein JY572_26250 [Myxococcus landrumus]
MRRLLLLVLILLMSCMRQPTSRSALPLEDTSIAFPDFFAREALPLDVPGQPYVLDGALLRALKIAADDFLPPELRGPSCWNRQESYRYRVLRQAGVYFVSIAADPEACRPEPRLLDGGVRYAIGLDGRILRRHFDGEPATPSIQASPPDAGTSVAPVDATPPVGDTTWGAPLDSVPSWWRDGGVTR